MDVKKPIAAGATVLALAGGAQAIPQVRSWEGSIGHTIAQSNTVVDLDTTMTITTEKYPDGVPQGPQEVQGTVPDLYTYLSNVSGIEGITGVTINLNAISVNNGDYESDINPGNPQAIGTVKDTIERYYNAINNYNTSGNGTLPYVPITLDFAVYNNTDLGEPNQIVLTPNASGSNVSSNYSAEKLAFIYQLSKDWKTDLGFNVRVQDGSSYGTLATVMFEDGIPTVTVLPLDKQQGGTTNYTASSPEDYNQASAIAKQAGEAFAEQIVQAASQTKDHATALPSSYSNTTAIPVGSWTARENDKGASPASPSNNR